MKHMIWRLMFCLYMALAVAEPVYSQDIIIYTKSGCPYCEQAREFLETAERRHPGFQYEERDITADAYALTAFRELIGQHDTERPAVPLMLVGDQLILGFRSPETPEMVTELLGWDDEDFPRAGLEPGGSLPPWLSLDRLGLPVFTVLLDLLDGFNLCVMWVLMFLLLYNIAYILDDSVMVFSATWALSSQRLKPGTGRLLKGLSGLVLLILSLCS